MKENEIGQAAISQKGPLRLRKRHSPNRKVVDFP